MIYILGGKYFSNVNILLSASILPQKSVEKLCIKFSVKCSVTMIQKTDSRLIYLRQDVFEIASVLIQPSMRCTFMYVFGNYYCFVHIYYSHHGAPLQTRFIKPVTFQQKL